MMNAGEKGIKLVGKEILIIDFSCDPQKEEVHKLKSLNDIRRGRSYPFSVSHIHYLTDKAGGNISIPFSIIESFVDNPSVSLIDRAEKRYIIKR